MNRIANLKSLRSSPALRSVGIYTFSNFFSKGVSFLLLFVYTDPRFITPSENGLLNLFSNSLAFLMPFLSMGIVFSTSSDFFKLNKEQFRDFFTTGFVMPAATMLISMAFLFLFRDNLKEAYGFPYSFVWIIPLVTFFTFCHEQLLAVARNNNEPGVHLKTNITKALIELGLSFLLVVFFAWRWEGRIAGILVAYVFVMSYCLYYFLNRKYLFGKIRTQFLKSEIIYAIPVIAMQASIFCMSAADKFILSHYTNDNNYTVGIYGIACIFASVIFLISNGLLQYFFPRIYTVLAMEKVNFREIRRLLYYYVLLMLAGTLLVMAFIYIVYTYFLNEKYTGALSYIYIICGGYLMWCLTYFFYSYLLYNKQKKKLLAISIGSIIISLAVDFYFISKWGAYGGAIATFVTYTAVFVYSLVISGKFPLMIFRK